MGSVPAPALVVTTSASGVRAGCLVGFAAQASIDPPRFAVWLSKENHTFRVAQSAHTLVVHVLRLGDEEWAHLFGGETGDEVDKFAGVDWKTGPDGCPVLPGRDWVAGSILERVDTGDHVAYVLAPHSGEAARHQARVLTLADLDIEAGHPVARNPRAGSTVPAAIDDLAGRPSTRSGTT